MKSQQQILQQILSVSIKRLKTKLSVQKLQQFQADLDKLPKKIKQLDATPYLFIFKWLGQFKDCADFTLHQYKRLIQERFIIASNPQVEKLLCELMLNNLIDQQFMITQLLMSITEPSVKYLYIFFNVHTTIPLPENVLLNFRTTGAKWLSRAFHFQKGRPIPYFIQLIANKMFGQNCMNLLFPTLSETQSELKDYIKKIVNGITFKISQSLQKSQAVSGKFGYCFMCLQPAQYYCKDTKIPVCGASCKKEHLKQINRNHYLSQQYPDSLRQQIEELLLANIQNRNSIALSVDYLCMIYIFSNYKTKNHLPHRALLHSPLIEQRIWLLEASYHWKKGQCFDHIFGYAMKHSKQYIRTVSQKYFLMAIKDYPEMISEIYWNYDVNGPYRIIPLIMSCIDKPEQSYQFVVSLQQLVFNSQRRGQDSEQNSSYAKDQQNMIKLFNEDSCTFYQWYRDKYSKLEQDYQLQIAKFIVRNQSLLNKDGLCQILAKPQSNKQANKESEQFCRVFLRYITQPLQYAPIDQVIRQIFYYVNVNISDRIYKLLELLFQVYHPPPLLPGYTEQKLFQFAYYLIMLHTDLHNPNIADKKPQFQDVLNRVKSFDDQLYKKRQPFLKQVYERMVEQPFSQKTKAISSYYRKVKNNAQNAEFRAFSPNKIIYDNWESIYQKLEWRVKNLSQADIEQIIRVLYKSCVNVAKKPSICQQFFILLVSLESKIKSKQHNLHLAQAISNVIQQQPNAVQSWKSILNLSLSFPGILQLGKMIFFSKNLTDSQLISFIKQMIIAFPLSSCPEIYINFLHINKQRIRIYNDHFLKLFIIEQNLYVQLLVLQSCPFLSNIYFEELNIQPKIESSQSSNHLNLVFESNQRLFIDTLNCITSQTDYCLNGLKWESIYKKSNSFTNLNVKVALAMLFKKSNIKDPTLCPFYQSYLITQTILTNSCLFIQQVDPQLNKSLAKFQQKIGQLSIEVKQLFVINQNLSFILDNFKHFFEISELYKLLRVKLQSLPKQTKQMLTKIMRNLCSLSNQQKQIVQYDQQFMKLIIQLVFYRDWSQQQLNQYFEVLNDLILTKFNRFYRQNLQNTDISSLARLGFFLLNTIQFFRTAHKRQQGQQIKLQMIPKIVQVFTELREKLKEFNENDQLRIGLMKKHKLDRMPGFFKHYRQTTLVLFQLAVVSRKQCVISQTLESVLQTQYESFLCLMAPKRQLHQNRQLEELLRKEQERQLMQWRICLKQMIQAILKLQISIKEKLKVVQKLLILNQSGYLQWNGQKLAIVQNQFAKVMRQFATFLLTN